MVYLFNICQHFEKFITHSMLVKILYFTVIHISNCQDVDDTNFIDQTKHSQKKKTFKPIKYLVESIHIESSKIMLTSRTKTHKLI